METGSAEAHYGDDAPASTVVEQEVSASGAKKYHVFISYRVRGSADTVDKTDGAFAEKLCDKLRGEVVEQGGSGGAIKDLRYTVFLDVQQLKAGSGYQEQFMNALASSCVVFPIVSEEGLVMMRNVEEGSLALELMAQGHLTVIPILVGCKTDGGYRKFMGFNTSVFPDAKNAGSNLTVRETIEALFKIQVIFVDPDDMGDKLQSIVLRFNTDIWPSYRHLWHDSVALAPEPTKICVQCHENYKESLNVDGSCNYHAGYDNGQYFQCCKTGEHRSKHHNDYKYSGFYEWMWSIRNFSDKYEIKFITISQEEFDKADPDIPIGKVSGMPSLDLKMEEDLLKAEAWWIYKDNNIVGIKLVATSGTCKTPAVTACYFSYVNDKAAPQLLRTVEISRALFGELRLPSPSNLSDNYPNLPKTARMKGDPLFPLPQPREPETFDLVYSEPEPKFKLEVFKVVGFGVPFNDSDRIVVDFGIKSLVEDIEVEEIECRWRMRNAAEGDEEPKWLLIACNGYEIVQTSPASAPKQENLPRTIKRAANASLKAVVDVNPNRGSLGKNWSHTFSMGRHGPILMDFKIKTKETYVSALVEYCFSKPINDLYPPPRTEKTLSLICIDNHPNLARYWIHAAASAEPTLESGSVVNLGFRNLDVSVQMLREAVLKSLADPSLNGVVKLLEKENSTYDPLGLKIFGLIDLECRRVYALRMEVFTESMQVVDWVLVPEYGDAVSPPIEGIDPIPIGTPAEVTSGAAEATGFDWENSANVQEWVEPRLWEQPKNPFTRLHLDGPPKLPSTELSQHSTTSAIDSGQLAELLEKIVNHKTEETNRRLSALESSMKDVDGKVSMILGHLDRLVTSRFDTSSGDPQAEPASSGDSRTTSQKLDAIEQRIAAIPSMVHRTIESALDSQAEVVSALVKVAIESRLSQYEEDFESISHRNSTSDSNVLEKSNLAEDAVRSVMAVPGVLGNGIVAGVNGVIGNLSAVVSQATGSSGKGSAEAEPLVQDPKSPSSESNDGSRSATKSKSWW
ncbi:hypothetical protein HDU97_009869 [Phlyctochytrium planicorne]|nr:hypothetical protein HDU97_009869 [Phlyctochytrium planicorne]